MSTLTTVLAILVALEHLYIMILETMPYSSSTSIIQTPICLSSMTRKMDYDFSIRTLSTRTIPSVTSIRCTSARLRRCW